MRALTLTQPWAGLVASGIKLVENRPRRIIKREDFGQRFAIHASREIDEATYARIYEIAPELRPVRVETRCVDSRWHQLSRTTSAVIAVATITHELHGGWDETTIDEHRNSLTETLAIHTGRRDQARWFFGPIGYVLRDVVALATPVPCKGKLGFWTLDAETERRVVEQLETKP